jgi:hypothetical protein
VSNPDVLWMALANLVPAIPVLVVWMVGLLVALARLKRHRRSSALLAAGLGGLLVQRLVLTPMYPMLSIWVMQAGYDASTVGMVYAGVALVENLFSALWYLLILAGAFLPDPSEPVVAGGVDRGAGASSGAESSLSVQSGTDER